MPKGWVGKWREEPWSHRGLKQPGPCFCLAGWIVYLPHTHPHSHRHAHLAADEPLLRHQRGPLRMLLVALQHHAAHGLDLLHDLGGMAWVGAAEGQLLEEGCAGELGGGLVRAAVVEGDADEGVVAVLDK